MTAYAPTPGFRSINTLNNLSGQGVANIPVGSTSSWTVSALGPSLKLIPWVPLSDIYSFICNSGFQYNPASKTFTAKDGSVITEAAAYHILGTANAYYNRAGQTGSANLSQYAPLSPVSAAPVKDVGQDFSLEEIEQAQEIIEGLEHG